MATLVKVLDGGIDTYVGLMLHCDGEDGSTTFTDSSLSPKTVTAQGTAQIDTAVSKFSGASCYLSGSTSNYLTVPESSDWDFGSGNFTVDLWWNLDVVDIGVTNSIIGQYGAVGNLGWLLDYSALGGGVRFFYTTDGTSGGSFQWNWAATADTWFHFALVRNSTTLKFFVNGAQIGTDGNIGATTIFNSTNVLGIGIYEGGGAPINYHRGWMDEIRVSKGVARYFGNFKAPESPYSQGISSVKTTNNQLVLI